MKLLIGKLLCKLKNVLQFNYLFLECIYSRSSSCLLMIYCSFCLQFYPTFTLPLKLTKIVNVLCSIIVIVSTAMRFFFYSFRFLSHVFSVRVCALVIVVNWCCGYFRQPCMSTLLGKLLHWHYCSELYSLQNIES